jgi:hypothetical protein
MSRKKVKGSRIVLTLRSALLTADQVNFSYFASVLAAPCASTRRRETAYVLSSSVRNLESFGVCGRKKRTVMTYRIVIVPSMN